MEEKTQICALCKAELPLSSFSVNKVQRSNGETKEYPFKLCKSCVATKAREKYRAGKGGNLVEEQRGSPSSSEPTPLSVVVEILKKMNKARTEEELSSAKKELDASIKIFYQICARKQTYYKFRDKCIKELQQYSSTAMGGTGEL